jgi:hypothetical protein
LCIAVVVSRRFLMFLHLAVLVPDPLLVAVGVVVLLLARPPR